MIEVVATQNGFYGGSRKRVGAVFNVEDGETGSWFVRTDGKALKGRKATKGTPERVKGSTAHAVDDLKANPAENDLKNAAGEKVGEKTDALEDKAGGDAALV
jgi:hypothetical protein